MKRYIANAILNTIGFMLGVIIFVLFCGIFYSLGGWPLLIGVTLFVALIVWCIENAN